ncbi:hypothetical protein [Arthrobacter sp. efr-133-R2A-120]|uniref:hypothetical protein n=1 Tax=Arthrobacter sp. efr-133-R2A-120 TaxID=3040277 RepID=UPI00254BE071|nr:hypothetical protein [Arthrobacter sp. efr-133-R2A-120]
MDAETLRLLITAGTAIVAGLGGAGLTAYINRRNTTDSLASARATTDEQWKRTQEREHTTWLRDQKMEAYTTFMLRAQSIHAEISAARFEEIPDVDPEELVIDRGKVKILGSPKVRYAARSLDTCVSEMFEAHMYVRIQYMEGIGDGKATEEDEDRIRARRHNRLMEALDGLHAAKVRFSMHLIDYVEEVRNDLGTATPDDHELNASNRALIDPDREIEDEEVDLVPDGELA